MQVIILPILLFVSLISNACSYNILAAFPAFGISHHIVGSALFKGLAENGHNVTVITSYPQKTPTKNLHVIQVICSDAISSMMTDFTSIRKSSGLELKLSTRLFATIIANCTLNHPKVRELIDSTRKFDAIIYEAIGLDAYIGFGHHFKAPVIGFSTFVASTFANRLVGTPSPLSYIPDTFLPYSDRMTFLERFFNILHTTIDNLSYSWIYAPLQEQIYQKAFPDPKPPLHELIRNVSLVLINSHFTLGYPRPYVPNMIEVGGLQVKRKPDILPTDLQKFLDSAKDGAIYFSMGTNLLGKNLPLEKRQAILKVIGSLKEKVIWKFEEDNLPEKPKNLLIKKWCPQDDILSHPNVKLFISHGGLLSTTESVYHAVPILGIPMFADQFLNVRKIVQAGHGIMLDFLEITEETFSAALQEILTNRKYTENARKASERYRDQQRTPLETAIYWIEYVIRHQGATHMRSAGQDLNFFQYHNLDVFVFIILLLVFVLTSSFMMIKRLLKFLHSFSINNFEKKNL